MPNPSEICVVTAGGQKYDNWKTVEVSRNYMDVIDHAMLTVAEISSPSAAWSTLKLKPGDAAQVTLGGKLVINGKVYLRQAVYDKETHAVQIGIASNSQSIIPSTVDANPGQYKNSTLSQIASAVFGKVGVKFSIKGNPVGAELPFPRVSEHVGETRFGFIERLCRLRNLHMVDDGQGGISATRGTVGNSPTTLQEGRNIFRARLLLRNDEYAEDLSMVSQHPNPTSGDDGRGMSAQKTLSPSVGRSIKLPAEDAADMPSLQHRVDHESDYLAFQTVDGDVTVVGWLLGDGSIWFDYVGALVTVNSPMLLPGNTMDFMIKGVVHKQSTEDGTTTDILLCRQDGLGAGSGEPLRNNGDYQQSSPAQPSPPDTAAT
jgi:prophage tail gpP-like protein